MSNTSHISPTKLVLSGILVVLIVVALFIMSRDGKLGTVIGSTGDKFRVLMDYDDHMDAAQLLDSVNNDFINFLRYLRGKYLVYRNVKTGGTVAYNHVMDADQGNLVPMSPPHLVDIVTRLVTNYNPEELIENRPGSGDTSYTLDKGRRMYMCIRSVKENGKLHDKNTVMFVLLHEAAHIGNAGWGHSAHDFWPIFKFLLYEAGKFGIIKNIDYSKQPVEFCSLQVNYSPNFDSTLPDIWKLGNWA